MGISDSSNDVGDAKRQLTDYLFNTKITAKLILFDSQVFNSHVFMPLPPSTPLTSTILQINPTVLLWRACRNPESHVASIFPAVLFLIS